MTDAELLALCVWDEARGEPAEGKAAVARVVLNRMHAHYQSDGTIPGTVLAPGQFSGFWFDWANGKYVRACTTRDEAATRAGKLLADAETAPEVWETCLDAAARVQAGTFRGPLYEKLGDAAVNYADLAYCNPAWAVPEKLVVEIGRHSFFRA
jgi:spore germination cell wall hydrolase CwlJ-like protein